MSATRALTCESGTRAEFRSRGHGSARGHHIIDDDDAAGPRLHLERGSAVFKLVREARHRRWQFALLADGDEALAPAQCQCRAQDEAAGFDAGDGIDLRPFFGSEQGVKRRNRLVRTAP